MKYENHSEVIDLHQKNSSCKNLPSFPIPISDAFGGLIKSKWPLICGGYNYENMGRQPKCFVIGKDKITTAYDLIEPRSGTASVVLNDEVIWVASGYIGLGNAGYATKSSEFVHIDKPTTRGPDLPMFFTFHCMTKINENLVILIEGTQTKKVTLLVDVGKNFTMKLGPELGEGREGHACETFTYNEKPLVIVAGGDHGDGGSNIKTTEILDFESGRGWLKGTTLLLFTQCNFIVVFFQ